MKADFNVQAIPVLPELADNVLRIVLEDDISVAKLSGIIEKDQAMTARILSLANSSHYRRSRTIYTVRDAVAVIGFDAVKTMAMGLCVLDLFPAPKGSGLNHKEFWRHCLACAVYARALMEQLDQRLASKAFSAGLLHDIGKLILDQCCQQQYAEVLERAKEGMRSLIDIEREMLGATHADIGRSALEKWGLPSIYVESIWSHHAPVQIIDEDQYRISAIIHLANMLAHMSYTGESGNCFPGRITSPVLKRFQFSTETLDEIMSRVPSEIDGICSSLGIDHPREGLFCLINKASMRLADVSLALQHRSAIAERMNHRYEIITLMMSTLNKAVKVSEALESSASLLCSSGLIKGFLGGLRMHGMNLVYEFRPGEHARFIRVGNEELKGMILSGTYPAGMSMSNGSFVYLDPADEDLGDDRILVGTIVEGISSTLKRIQMESARHEESELLRQSLSSAAQEKLKNEEILSLCKDMENPLGAIHGFTGILLEDFAKGRLQVQRDGAPDPDFPDMLSNMTMAIENMLKIIAQIQDKTSRTDSLPDHTARMPEHTEPPHSLHGAMKVE